MVNFQLFTNKRLKTHFFLAIPNSCLDNQHLLLIND